MGTIREDYTKRYNEALTRIAKCLEEELKENLTGTQHIDRVSARAKSIDRFVAKAEKIENGKPKYDSPLSQIQDQIGARIIVFYLNDIENIENIITKYYTKVEERQLIPESEKEFGYEGKHYILLLPKDIVDEEIDSTLVPTFFELQIKTLYQHAFSEASHDLAYKPSIELDRDQKRKVAFTAAQSWGADQIFSELNNELE